MSSVISLGVQVQLRDDTISSREVVRRRYDRVFSLCLTTDEWAVMITICITEKVNLCDENNNNEGKDTRERNAGFRR